MASLNPSEQVPSRSPGSEGSRGSRGVGNAGAQDDELQQRQPAPEGGQPATEDADARGGGGAGSNSGRSKQERAMPDPISGQGVGARPKKQPYTLYATGGRVYAQNVTYAIVDLGALTREPGQGGTFCYLLDGNKLSGAGFATAEAALRDIASRLHFLWLDGQFTALADVRDKIDLKDAARLEIALDELGPNERIEDAAV